ncbi:MAG: hypothetical protein K6F84_08435 [Lachnospiraceae bacterium]|nr:hypothetical protein [Lachnospiraceae bacterium]
MGKNKSKALFYIMPVVLLGTVIFIQLCTLIKLPEKRELNNVTLASFPEEKSLKAFMDGSFQKQLDSWLGDHFYGHTNAVMVHNQVDYSIFKDASGNVAQGKEGYLYIKDQTPLYVSGKKTNDNTWDDYLSYAGKLKNLQDILNANNKDFVLLLTPIKAEIYPDKLPWYFKLLNKKYSDKENAIHDTFVRALKECGVNYYDVTDDLKKMRDEVDFEVFSKTGQHWTLTAAAYEMNSIFDRFEDMSEFTKYPRVDVVDVNDGIFAIDKDLLDMQNVFWYKEADRYTKPVVKYTKSDDSIYIFGTSYIHEIWHSLYGVDETGKDLAFNSITAQQYFVSVTDVSEKGANTTFFSEGEDPYDLGITRRLKNSSLLLMEQCGAFGVTDHIAGINTRFVDYLTGVFDGEDYSLTGNMLRDKSYTGDFELTNFDGPEELGRWSLGDELGFTMHDSLCQSDSEKILLCIDAHSFSQDRDAQIWLNDTLIDTVKVKCDSTESFSFELPTDLLKDRDNVVAIRLSGHSVSPKELGEGDDERSLGLFVENMEIISSGER